MNDPLNIPTRLAAALLLKRGEISLDEISSLPFVENKEFAETIVIRLTQHFEIDCHESNASRSVFPIDDVIRLVGQQNKDLIGQPANPGKTKGEGVVEKLLCYLDNVTRQELENQATLHGNSIETEASLILRDVLTSPENTPPTPSDLVSSIRDKFAPLGGLELELPLR